MKKKKKNSLFSKGFTLVELIIVIAIMAILAGLVAPNVIKYIKKARASRATDEAQIIVQAINTAVASGRVKDISPKLTAQYIDENGIEYKCGVVTNWVLSRAQDTNVTIPETDPEYVNYQIALEILENLSSSSEDSLKFYKFTGSQTNPIGANCESFYDSYGCPGIIAVYGEAGKVVYLEYYNHGCLIRFEGGGYSHVTDESFVGAQRIKLNIYSE